jgi:hypothetical protein
MDAQKSSHHVPDDVLDGPHSFSGPSLQESCQHCGRWKTICPERVREILVESEARRVLKHGLQVKLTVKTVGMGEIDAKVDEWRLEDNCFYWWSCLQLR